MSERPVIKVDLSFLAEPATMIAVGILAGGFLLVKGIIERSATAYMILGGLIFVVVAGVGAVFVLGVQRISEGREARREAREQMRFRDNTKENLAIMQMMANTQTAQARMLSAHQTALTKALPAPEHDTVDADYVAFNPALLADIDEELEV